MITEKEIEAVDLSPTKKDYYQIWNELIEAAEKLSTIWHPESTNESDPGIIILKLLCAVADKLNYNIDKNILEAFLPSAAQEESVRKLCEVLGYTPKYYRAASGDVTISFKEANNISLNSISSGIIYFPKFVNIKDLDDTINYVTIEDFSLSTLEKSKKVAVLEGQLIECETTNDGIISAMYLDDSNRFILPELNVAENGIFITNVSDSAESDLWERVDNLNYASLGVKIYKVGFDSKQGAPYVQFPEDIDQLIGDGLKIRYIRTNGTAGNISAKQLSKVEVPSLWKSASDENIQKLTTDNFSVQNISAIKNGRDKETIDESYNNFKRTVGTYETLVSCRDYMNKIYDMTVSETNTTPLASNINVTDIRDDINRAITLCSFNEYGILYEDMSQASPNASTMSHFDLILYPFKTIYGLNTKTEYTNSFCVTDENFWDIQKNLEKNKTVSHHLVYPSPNEIALIKNMMKVRVKVTTIKKVTTAEELEILARIRSAIYENFNMRKVEFGEDIPESTIIDVIKNASTLIKDIDWNTPEYYTVISTVNGNEYAIDTTNWTGGTLSDADKIYNTLVLRNILAGKISAFEYDETFVNDFCHTHYKAGSYKDVYGKPSKESTSNALVKLTSKFDLNLSGISDSNPYTLKQNEVILFRSRNLRTKTSYPPYTNYYLKLNSSSVSGGTAAIPATFMTIRNWMNATKVGSAVNNKWTNLANASGVVFKIDSSVISEETFNTSKSKNGCLFKANGTNKEVISEYSSTVTSYYYIDFKESFVAIITWLKSDANDETISEKTYSYAMDSGLFKRIEQNASREIGKYVDQVRYKYVGANECVAVSGSDSYWDKHFVQQMHTTQIETSEGWTIDGLGRDGEYAGIAANGTYSLKDGEYLYINYTQATTDESGNDTKTVMNETYGYGTIIQPNFKIVDSEIYHSSHSYSKKDGFNFEGADLKGMFTLGSSEQIDIKEPIEVVLDETSYIYWERIDDDNSGNYCEFVFDETIDNTPNKGYTLKDGEYFYITDEKKLDLFYYGSGTQIIRSNTSLQLLKPTLESEISVEKLITDGDISIIPWVEIQLDSGTGRGYLTLYENKYITLTEGDKIYELTASTDRLSNTYVSATAAKYSFYEEGETSSTISELPVITVPNCGWYVRSRLNFNMGPTVDQILDVNDSIQLDFYAEEGETAPASVILTPQMPSGGTEKLPIYLNSNISLAAAVDTLDVRTYEYDLNDDAIETDLTTIRLSTYEKPTTKDNNTLNINNYSSIYTKFSCSTLLIPDSPSTEENRKAFTLKVDVPSDCEFGVVMFYYVDKDCSTGKAKAKIKSFSNTEGTTSTNGIRLMKNVAFTSSLELVSGINVIRVKKDVQALTIYADEEFKSTLVFSQVRNVKGINPKLCYKGTLNSLLEEIKNTTLGDKFYYSVNIESDNAIDINPYLEDDTLASPESWYDVNNMNNKFVITEIEPDSLVSGISLTKASRR